MAIYRARVTAGRLELPPHASMVLQKAEGRDVEITIQPWSDSRTNRQNRYYWGCVIDGAITALRHDWGVTLTPQAAHDACRAMFLGAAPMGPKGVLVARSTTTLSTTEFSAYVDTIRHWALHECGVLIPTPDEVGF